MRTMKGMKLNMKKRYIKTSLMILSSILLFILSFWFLKMGYHNYTQDVIKYNEKGTIDYQVYLKENNFFETPFLGKGNVYITSLIDYINVDFNYNLKLDSKRSGQYKYYVKGIISANISNTDTNYWKKEFSLSDEKVVDYKNEDTIKITPKVKIDYQKYNDLLLEFKKQYSLTMDGNLKVILYVENDIDSNIDKQHLNKINTTSLEIPLTKATIEVPIKLNEVNQDNSLRTPLVYFDSIKYPILKITGVILLLIGSYLLLRTVLIIVKRFEKNLII